MRVNGTPRSGEPVSVRALLEEFNIDGRGIAVARNGEVVPRSSWEDEVVSGEDEIEIVTAAAGG